MRGYRRGRIPGRSFNRIPVHDKPNHLCLITKWILIQLAIDFGNSTRCTVVTTPAHKASITCRFQLDLNQTKRSFCVIQYDGDKKRTDVVTACSWRNTETLCVFEEGFHFHPHTISDQFTVELPVQKAKGEFSCDTIPPDLNVEVEKCTLSSTGIDKPMLTTTPQPCCNTTRLAQTSEKCQVERIRVIALTCLCAVLVCSLLVVLALVYVCSKRQQRNKAGYTSTKQYNTDFLKTKNCNSKVNGTIHKKRNNTRDASIIV